MDQDRQEIKPRRRWLLRKRDQVTGKLARDNLQALLCYERCPWRMIGVQFMAGIARGVGMALGFSLLGALAIYIIQALFRGSMPSLGEMMMKLGEGLSGQ